MGYMAIGSVLTGKGEQTMRDREKVIKGLECLTSMSDCTTCPYSYNKQREFCLCDIGKDAKELLKAQEAVKPVLDEQTGRIWLCGKCGSYVGFEDNDPYDQNEFDKYCRECGRPVLWEGR